MSGPLSCGRGGRLSYGSHVDDGERIEIAVVGRRASMLSLKELMKNQQDRLHNSCDWLKIV